MAGNNKKLKLIEWFGFRADSNFEDHRRLGIAVGFLLSALMLVLAILAIASVFLMVAVVIKSFGNLPSNDLGNTLRGIAFALGAIVGLPFLVWRSWVAQRQADTAEQGLLTDRINKAVQGLGAEKTAIPPNQSERNAAL
jgi:ABC-type nickel/cobalt efflux system permease component RcnA